MVVKCPSCGQQVRGEPGQSGPCPKCGQRFTFPVEKTQILDEPIPLDVERKKFPLKKILIVVLVFIIFAAGVIVIPIKFSGDMGFVSLGMTKDEILEISVDENAQAGENEINFLGKCPFLLFGPEVLYRVVFSETNNTVQEISVSYFDSWREVNSLYEALKIALAIKYGAGWEDHELLGIAKGQSLENQDISVSISMIGSQNDACAVLLTCS